MINNFKGLLSYLIKKFITKNNEHKFRNQIQIYLLKLRGTLIFPNINPL